MWPHEVFWSLMVITARNGAAERLPVWGLHFYFLLYKTTVTFDTQKKHFLFVLCIKDPEFLVNVDLLIRMCTECKSFGKSFPRLIRFDIENMDKVLVKSLKTKAILRKYL